MENVTVYTQPNCVFCERTKRFLDNHNVEYTIVDVEEHPEQRDKLINEWGFRQVPVVDVEGIDRWVGHRPDLILKEIING